MTQEEFDKFEKELQEHGYRRYAASDFEHFDFYWAKSVYKKEDRDDDDSHADIMITFRVYDWHKYVDHDPYLREQPYGVEVEIFLDWFDDWNYFRPLVSTEMPIARIEEMADSLYEWAKQFNNKKK